MSCKLSMFLASIAEDSCPSCPGTLYLELTAGVAAGQSQADGGPGPLFSSPMAAGIIGRQQTLSSQLADSTAQEAQAAASLAALMLSLYPSLIPETSALDGLSL